MNLSKALVLIGFIALPAHSQKDSQKSPFQTAIDQLASSDAAQRRLGVRGLSRLRKAEAIPALERALKDEDPTVRKTAVEAIGAHRGRAKSAAPAIASLLESDVEPSIRQTAAIALGNLRNPATSNSLLAAMSDPNDGVRFAAMRSLGLMRVAAAVEPLKDLATDRKASPQYRRAAVQALGEIGGDSVVPTLSEVLDEKEVSLRRATVEALARTRSRTAVQVLRGMLIDQDKQTRLKAALGLANLGDNGGQELAIEFLSDPEVGIRTQAASALARIGDADKAFAALKTALSKEKSASPRRVIEYALNSLKARHGIRDGKK